MNQVPIAETQNGSVSTEPLSYYKEGQTTFAFDQDCGDRIFANISWKSTATGRPGDTSADS
jgi:hypothetical protein